MAPTGSINNEFVHSACAKSASEELTKEKQPSRRTFVVRSQQYRRRGASRDDHHELSRRSRPQQDQDYCEANRERMPIGWAEFYEVACDKCRPEGHEIHNSAVGADKKRCQNPDGAHRGDDGEADTERLHEARLSRLPIIVL